MPEDVNKTPPEEGKESEPQIKWLKTADAVRFYSNNVQLGFSTWDMWFVFGEALGMEGEKVLVEPRARITMSLEHAKQFAEILQKNIALFEDTVGKIPAFTAPPADIQK
jgi:Protein of unknown function (DUF3467)